MPDPTIPVEHCIGHYHSKGTVIIYPTGKVIIHQLDGRGVNHSKKAVIIYPTGKVIIHQLDGRGVNLGRGYNFKLCLFHMEKVVDRRWVIFIYLFIFEWYCEEKGRKIMYILGFLTRNKSD